MILFGFGTMLNLFWQWSFVQSMLHSGYRLSLASKYVASCPVQLVCMYFQLLLVDLARTSRSITLQHHHLLAPRADLRPCLRSLEPKGTTHRRANPNSPVPTFAHFLQHFFSARSVLLLHRPFFLPILQPTHQKYPHIALSFILCQPNRPAN